MSKDTAHQTWVKESVSEYQTRLIRYARGITGDSETARDVVQDTFLKLCGQDRSHLNGRLAPWLYTVCRNRALDIRRKEGRMNTLSPATLGAKPGSMPEPNVVAARNEDHAAVFHAVGELPEEQKEVFRLKFEHHMTYREIAKVMDKPLSTVSFMMTKALKTLRVELRDHMSPNNPGRLKEASHE
jgi:RNA polymerase sigma-70 factor (ECF subfamily)